MKDKILHYHQKLRGGSDPFHQFPVGGWFIATESPKGRDLSSISMTKKEKEQKIKFLLTTKKKWSGWLTD